MVLDGRSSASMRSEVWAQGHLFQCQFRPALPLAVMATEEVIMEVDATKLESTVSPILFRPAGQDGVSCQTRINLLSIFH